jgi:hypothetical protein
VNARRKEQKRPITHLDSRTHILSSLECLYSMAHELHEDVPGKILWGDFFLWWESKGGPGRRSRRGAWGRVEARAEWSEECAEHLDGVRVGLRRSTSTSAGRMSNRNLRSKGGEVTCYISAQRSRLVSDSCTFVPSPRLQFIPLRQCLCASFWKRWNPEEKNSKIMSESNHQSVCGSGPCLQALHYRYNLRERARAWNLN